MYDTTISEMRIAQTVTVTNFASNSDAVFGASVTRSDKQTAMQTATI